jgi:choline dehydrogenase
LGFARRIFAAPPLNQFVREESLPDKDVQTDDELLDYARRNGSTCYHASCTCMMGRHAMAVVDDELCVHGLDGLRVIDASVMPAVTSTNTNAPTIMVAEKGAAIIKGAAPAATGGIAQGRRADIAKCNLPQMAHFSKTLTASPRILSRLCV